MVVIIDRIRKDIEVVNSILDLGRERNWTTQYTLMYGTPKSLSGPVKLTWKQNIRVHLLMEFYVLI